MATNCFHLHETSTLQMEAADTAHDITLYHMISHDITSVITSNLIPAYTVCMFSLIRDNKSHTHRERR
jgi:hypothetical protein